MRQNSSQSDFFDSAAENWDSTCFHDPSKISKLISLCSLKERACEGIEYSVLDAGTGTGVLIPFIAHLAPFETVHIDAADISENMIRRAREKLKNYKNVDFHVCDVIGDEFTSARREKYDAIFLYSIFPHFGDAAHAVSRLGTLVKKGGTIHIMHSESKEALNEMHSRNSKVKEAVLPEIRVLKDIFIKNGFTVTHAVDCSKYYFLSSQKNYQDVIGKCQSTKK